MLLKFQTAEIFDGKQFKPTKLLNYLNENPQKVLSASSLMSIINADLNDFLTNTLSEEQVEALLAEKAKSSAKSGGSKISYVEESCTEDEVMSRGMQTSAISPLLKGPGYCALMGITAGWTCGCCGNYNGPCACCSPICMAHDVACERCDHWYCGWACVSGEC